MSLERKMARQTQRLHAARGRRVLKRLEAAWPEIDALYDDVREIEKIVAEYNESMLEPVGAELEDAVSEARRNLEQITKELQDEWVRSRSTQRGYLAFLRAEMTPDTFAETVADLVWLARQPDDIIAEAQRLNDQEDRQAGVIATFVEPSPWNFEPPSNDAMEFLRRMAQAPEEEVVVCDDVHRELFFFGYADASPSSGDRERSSIELHSMCVPERIIVTEAGMAALRLWEMNTAAMTPTEDRTNVQ